MRCKTIPVRHWRIGKTIFLANAILLTAFALAAGQARAEQIKIGTVRTLAGGPLYIAQERGYFTAEDIGVDLVYFNSSPPVAVATLSGAVDFGVTNPTGAFYNLAAQGALRIIAGATHEASGFHFFGYLASRHAYAAGLKSLKDLPGHSVALGDIGGPAHYAVALAAEKYGLDLNTIQLLPPLGSIANMISAVAGGQADFTMMSSNPALLPLIQSGDIRRIGWAGDETPWQLSAVFTTTKTADQRRDTVERFLRAYRKGTRDYHDAVAGADATRQNGPTAAAVFDIIAKYTGVPVEEVELDVPYHDVAGRLDVNDILRQIAWYKAQGMLKGEVDGDAVIDKRYVVPLP